MRAFCYLFDSNVLSMLRHNAGMNHFPIPPGILPSRRRTLQLLGGLAASGTLLAAAPQPLRIGVIASWSGPYADYGRQFDAGMEVYLQQHGERLGGLPVEQRKAALKQLEGAGL